MLGYEMVAVVGIHREAVISLRLNGTSQHKPVRVEDAEIPSVPVAQAIAEAMNRLLEIKPANKPVKFTGEVPRLMQQHRLRFDQATNRVLPA